jgi:hypothetical protein
MRMFGNSAMVLSRGPVSPMVKVGRDDQRRLAANRTRTMVKVGEAASPNGIMDPGVGSGTCTSYDWSRACDRPLSIPRTSIAAGATTIFDITPCGPYRLGDAQGRVFSVPESFALLFEITQIKVCRTDYIEDNAWPAESFSNQGPGVTLGCGSVFFPSLPLKVGVKNVSGAAATFAMLIFGKELSLC